MVASIKQEVAGEFAPYRERDADTAARGTTEQRALAPTLAGKRILFITPQPFYEDRGSPIAVLQVVRAMSELGMHVDLMAFTPGQPVDVDNLRIFRSGTALGIRHVPIGFSFRKVLLDLFLVRAVRSRLKSVQYDCVHALEDGIFVARAAGVAGRLPVIYDMASCIPEQLSKHWLFRNRYSQWLLKRLERRALLQSTIVSCSVGLKDYVKSNAPGTPVQEWSFSDPDTGPAAQALNEPARFLRAELGIARDAPVILYTGNFQDYQGVETLVEAMPIVRQAHPGAVLVLLGADNAADVERLVKLGNGTTKVCLRQPRELVGKYLHMAQVLVSPRKCGDNLPLKLFEYMAAGKPIVATENKHHRKVLSEDRAVFASNTAAGLGAAIRELLDDPDRMQRLAAAAKAYSETEHGWRKFVGSVSALYVKALQQRTGRE